MLSADVKVYLPVGVADSATSVTSSSTTATALPSGAKRIWLSAAEPMSIIFGTAGVAVAVVATCMPLQADLDYVFDVPSGVTHFRAIAASSTGILFISAVG
jgi:choline-glycine betaine transporter